MKITLLVYQAKFARSPVSRGVFLLACRVAPFQSIRLWSDIHFSGCSSIALWLRKVAETVLRALLGVSLPPLVLSCCCDVTLLSPTEPACTCCILRLDLFQSKAGAHPSQAQVVFIPYSRVHSTPLPCPPLPFPSRPSPCVSALGGAVKLAGQMTGERPQQ